MSRLLAMVKVVSAVGMGVVVAFVAVGFWHRRQLEADLEGHGEHVVGPGSVGRNYQAF